MEFRKTIKIEPSDYISFNLYAFRRQLMLMPAAIFALALVYCVANGSADKAGAVPFALIFLPIAVVFAGLTVGAYIVMMRVVAIKQYRSSRVMQSPSELVVDETGVHESSEFGSNNIPWLNIFKAAESSRAFYIFFSKMQAFIVPKRLITGQETEVIRELLKKCLPSEKYRPRK